MQRILFPTDGSDLSERALESAAALAQAQDAELVLVRIVEPLRWVDSDGEAGSYDSITPEMYDEVQEAINEEAQARLDELTDGLRGRGLRIRTIVLHGFAASELLDCELREEPDLVVMASHGRTGLARFALGSVADRLVREGTTPVLVTRSFEGELSKLETALVPLDGSPAAEHILPMIEALAGRPLRAVELLRAVQSRDGIAEALAYLRSVAARISSEQIQVTTSVEMGHPVEAIEAEAKAHDLVMMATHGLGGYNRFRHGSVAERSMRHVTKPVLLIRIGMPVTPSTGLQLTEPVGT
jgi:nucleotide-binding universal stress UspA family protein